jgi:uncharacterized delta-60 repeat protein
MITHGFQRRGTPLKRDRRRRPGWTRRALAVAGGSLIALAMSVPSAAAAASGTIDSSFGQNGFATVSLGSTAAAAATVVQTDGKIVTAGQATVNGENVIVATRMTPDGNLDPTYGVGGIVTVQIYGGAGVDSGAALALQSDGKIVIAGGGHNGTYGPLAFAAVRLTPSGALDQSFGKGGITTVAISGYSLANAVVLQPDGKIVLAGTAYLSHNVFAATRLNANGTLDTSFGSHGITTLTPTASAWGLALQGDGKLLLAGQADYQNPSLANAQQFMAARLNANGTVDNTYGQRGIDLIPVGATALGYGVALQSDGRAILAGPAFTNTNVNAAVRLNTNGTIDSSYGNRGIATVNDYYGANGILIDGSGKVLLPSVGPSVLRLNTDGTADQTFGNGGNVVVPFGANGAANGAALQADGKIILAGATSINGRTEILVARIS